MARLKSIAGSKSVGGTKSKALPKSVSSESRARRKLIEFDDQTWHAMDLLAHDSMSTIQELADEAFRDLLKKHGRPTDLKDMLRQSARTHPANENPAPKGPPSSRGRRR
jgi:hypothetical protein